MRGPVPHSSWQFALTSVLICLGLAGCAAPEIRFVTDSAARLERNGFSVLSPSGEHWMVGPSGPYGVIFGKVITDPHGSPHTFVVLVETGQLKDKKLDLQTEQGLKDATTYIASEGDPSRFRLIDAKYSSIFQDQGTDCIRFEMATEQRKSPNHPGEVLLIDAKGVVCRHPTSPEYTVQATYSERRHMGSSSMMSEELRGEIEHSVGSVQFTPLKSQ